MFALKSGPATPIGPYSQVHPSRNAKVSRYFPGPVGSRSRRFCPGHTDKPPVSLPLLSAPPLLLVASRSSINSTRKPRHPFEIPNSEASKLINAAARAGSARALPGPLLRRRAGTDADAPLVLGGRVLHRQRGGGRGASPGAVARRRRSRGQERRRKRGEGGGGLLLGRVGAGGDGRD